MLNDAKIKAAKAKAAPYKLGDSEQLFLLVSTAGGKHWRMNYTLGRSKKDPAKLAQKTLALGSYPAMSLIEARRERDRAKEFVRQGIDPAAARRDRAKADAIAAENTFRSVATS